MNFLNKINIIQILKNHLSTLKNDNTKKAGFDDWFTFLILPSLITGLLIYFKKELKDDAINIIITTLSILVGLLFNVIVLIFDIIKRDATQKIKNTILKELLSNISFTILISILAIILTLFTFIEDQVARLLFTGGVYFLLSVFIFTVLMILKRMHKLFKNEIEELEKNNVADSL